MVLLMTPVHGLLIRCVDDESEQVQGRDNHVHTSSPPKQKQHKTHISTDFSRSHFFPGVVALLLRRRFNKTVCYSTKINVLSEPRACVAPVAYLLMARASGCC